MQNHCYEGILISLIAQTLIMIFKDILIYFKVTLPLEEKKAIFSFAISFASTSAGTNFHCDISNHN